MGTLRTTTVKFIRQGTKGDKGDPGTKGDRGAVLRGPQKWEDLPMGYQFMSGSDGELFFDVVEYNDNHYVCVTSHVKRSDYYPGSAMDNNARLWQLGTKLMLIAARLALIEKINAKDIDVDSLFAEEINANNGLIKNLRIINAVVTGRLRSVFETFAGTNSVYSDNFYSSGTYVSSPNQSANPEYLSVTPSDSGRLVRVVAKNLISIATKDGSRKIMSDGVLVNNVYAKDEIVELIGYGTETTFNYWVVLNRKPLERDDTSYPPRFGRDSQLIARGFVHGTSSGATLTIAAPYNGQNYSVYRVSEGRYRIYIPYGTFESADDIFIMCTGSVSADGVYAKPTVMYKTTSYIDIATSDDATVNDGDFYFELSNLRAWGFGTVRRDRILI